MYGPFPPPTADYTKQFFAGALVCREGACRYDADINRVADDGTAQSALSLSTQRDINGMFRAMQASIQGPVQDAIVNGS